MLTDNLAMQVAKPGMKRAESHPWTTVMGQESWMGPHATLQELSRSPKQRASRESQLSSAEPWHRSQSQVLGHMS